MQRFSSPLALNPHFHALFVDGAYGQAEQSGALALVATPAIENKARDALLKRIVGRVIELLKRRALASDEGFTAASAADLDSPTQLIFEAMRPPQTGPSQKTLRPCKCMRAAHS